VKNAATALSNRINEAGVLGVLIALGIQVLQVIVSPIPGQVIEITMGICYGSIGGALLCLLGSAIGAAIIMVFVKKYGVKVVELFISSEQINSMKDLLTERLHSTIFRIPDDEDYNATYEICNAAESAEIEELLKDKANCGKHKLELQFQANNNTQKRIEALKESAPEKAKNLIELGNKAAGLRKKGGIDIESASVGKPVISRMARIALTLVTLPYTIPASLLASPMAMLCKFIFTKLKDRAFRNSVRFLMNLFVWPLLVIIYSIIAFSLLPLQWALPVALLTIPAPIVAHELWKSIRLTVSDIKLLKNKELTKIYSQIREIVNGKQR
jgi:hypothetical protein